jgi:hypothetical protein
MSRFYAAWHRTQAYRPLLKLALLAGSLLALTLGGGAPFCDDPNGGCYDAF